MSARDQLTDALYGLGWGTVKKLPEPVAVRLGRTIADLAWKQRGKGVQRLESNYARVLPDASPERLRRALARRHALVPALLDGVLPAARRGARTA